MILAFMLDEEQRGKPAIIAEGHKKTRAGFFPALQAEGIGTCSTTVYFLKHAGYIEQVKPLEQGSASSFSGFYRLTAKGKEALRG